MKRLLLSLPYGMSARNFLGSSVFALLKEKFKIVIATPLYSDASFCSEFARQGVEIVDIPRPPVFPLRVYRRFLDVVECVYFTKKTNIGTLRILKECLRKDNPILYYGRMGLGSLVLAVPGLFNLLQKMQGLILKMPYYDRLLEKYRPDVIFQTHPLSIEELPMALCARKAKVPIVAMIHSWDNITAKTGIRGVTLLKPGRMLPMQFDHVLVWNDIQRNELMQYYGYSRDQISVTGIPQFDFYKTYRSSERSQFFNQWGFDEKRKLIVFAAGSPFLLPKQNEIIEILIDLVTSSRLLPPVQLLIRAHPKTDMSYLKNKSLPSSVRVQYPGAGYVADRVTAGWGDSFHEQAEFVETLKHADIVINAASTVCLDCAALDRPAICICFDGYQNNPYHSSIVKHYDYDHFLPVARSGGVRIARSLDQLVDYINAYLVDPSLDKEGRSRLCETECYRVDGCSSERVVAAITAYSNRSSY